jgi:hypothetical protein
VVQLIAEDGHSGPAEGGQNSKVCGETRREQGGGTRLLPICEFGFELVVDWSGPNDEA